MTYVDAVRTKKVPNPGTASFDTIEAAKQDPLILPKLLILHGHLKDVHSLSDEVSD